MERQRWLDGTLYSPDFEQDSCGFGLIAQLDNQPSHTLVQNAIGSLACMTHRGAIAADGKSAILAEGPNFDYPAVGYGGADDLNYKFKPVVK